MKQIAIVLTCILVSFSSDAQSLIGAWKNTTTTAQGDQLETVVIFTEAYQVSTTYNTSTGEFIKSNGGSWSIMDNTITETIEFNTDNPELVGAEVDYKVKLTTDAFQIVESQLKFVKIDNGSPGQLQGAWLMSGRVRNGKTQLRDISRPRKTMKILSGTRFQWIAYNTKTKQFLGTGGGTYTTKNGIYTEHIKFFSKDTSKAGISLEFNFKIENDQWIHTGFSSKGDPIHEIWSLRL
ncbi:DUF4488 domain-containing protein [Winogradskyella sediminis]|uniref:DUF4488 domain-containing protein n=1 Tax=Winogradskyella sediminis TaxID=1382466 RepID=UPI000E25D119|nr:DUF4488 domain-containing protein [Winogradskyella sediminis]REG89173.1 uncharacterized protein DUF4488 [Winogradskyella sediminis]